MRRTTIGLFPALASRRSVCAVMPTTGATSSAESQTAGRAGGNDGARSVNSFSDGGPGSARDSEMDRTSLWTAGHASLPRRQRAVRSAPTAAACRAVRHDPSAQSKPGPGRSPMPVEHASGVPPSRRRCRACACPPHPRLVLRHARHNARSRPLTVCTNDGLRNRESRNPRPRPSACGRTEKDPSIRYIRFRSRGRTDACRGLRRWRPISVATGFQATM